MYLFDLIEELSIKDGDLDPQFAKAMHKYLGKPPPNVLPELTAEQEAYFRAFWRNDKKALVAELEKMMPKGSEDMRAKTMRAAAAFRLKERVKQRPPIDPFFKHEDKKDLLYRMGTLWWPHTYADGRDDIDAGRAVNAYLTELEKTDPDRARELADITTAEDTATMIYGSARWADQAFPVVQLGGHKYAAALMSTKVPNDPDIKMPWKAFLIELPTELLWTSMPDGTRFPLTYVLVYQHLGVSEKHGTRECLTFMCFSKGGPELYRLRQPIAELVQEEKIQNNDDEAFPSSFVGEEELTNQDERVLFLVTRLVLNVCWAMSDPDTLRQMGKHPNTTGEQRRFAKEPTFRVFRVGKPIELDCRPALNDFVKGVRRGPLVVQFLVRGHWRNQACGPKMANHKVIWIQPFWKGPEDAPINVRPHVLTTEGA